MVNFSTIRGCATLQWEPPPRAGSQKIAYSRQTASTSWMVQSPAGLWRIRSSRWLMQPVASSLGVPLGDRPRYSSSQYHGTAVGLSPSSPSSEAGCDGEDRSYSDAWRAQRMNV